MLEVDLIAEFKLRTAIAAVVADRVSDTVLPQSPTYPAIVIQRISTPRERTLSGPSGLASPRIQVGCYADSGIAGKQLAAIVRGEFDGFRGKLSAGGTMVDECSVLDERSLYDDDVEKFVTQLDFEIWHQE
jgi:hypothetical protein